MHFLIKVHDSAPDSPCYLPCRPHAALNEREKTPSEGNSGHFDVMRSILNDGKASDVPHTDCYGYTNIA